MTLADIHVRAACDTCARRRLGTLGCDAFPERIPLPIIRGRNDHRATYPDDHGLQYLEGEPHRRDAPSPPVAYVTLRKPIALSLDASPFVRGVANALQDLRCGERIDLAIDRFGRWSSFATQAAAIVSAAFGFAYVPRISDATNDRPRTIAREVAHYLGGELTRIDLVVDLDANGADWIRSRR